MSAPPTAELLLLQDKCIAALTALDGSSLTEAEVADKVRRVLEEGGLVCDDSNTVVKLSFCVQKLFNTEIAKEKIASIVRSLTLRPNARMHRIFTSADTIAGYSVLIGEEDKAMVELRHVAVREDVKTPLWKNINSQIIPAASAVSIIVGGTSGGGKTFSLLSQSSEREHVIVAYMQSLPADTAFKNVADTSERNEIVLASIVERLEKIIPHETALLMSGLPENISPPLKVLVAMDEVGGCGHAVRAVCALTGKAVKDRLAATLNMRFPESVVFFLAAAGTGLGSDFGGDDSTEKTNLQSIGSLCDGSTPFVFFSTLDDEADARKCNVDIFWSQLKSLDLQSRSELKIDPLVMAFVEDNARMAALVGSSIETAIGSKTPHRDPRAKELFQAIDQTHFLTPAALQFKRLNGLEKLTLEELWPLLVQAVRLHFFPNALTRESRHFEVRYGLVSRRSLNAGTRAEEGNSSVALPPVSVLLLSRLAGLPVISRSLVSGMALEEFALVALFLIACAACDDELLLVAMDEFGGRLAPLERVRYASSEKEEHEKEGAIKREAAGGDAPKRVGVLPSPSDNALLSVIHDFSRGDKVPSIRCEDPHTEREGTADEEALNDETGAAKNALLAGVKAVLGAFKDRVDKHCESGPRRDGSACGFRGTFVAAFRCHDKAPFADLILFVGRSVFLCQCKDTAGPIRHVREELDKMGGAKEDAQLVNAGADDEAQVKMGEEKDGNTVKKREAENQAKKKRAESRKLLEALVREWAEATGCRDSITVHMCFVTPGKTSPAEGSIPAADCPLNCGPAVQATIDPKVRFLSVDALRFLRFDPSRERAAPFAAGVLPVAHFLTSRPSPLAAMAAEQGAEAKRDRSPSSVPANPSDRAVKQNRAE